MQRFAGIFMSRKMLKLLLFTTAAFINEFSTTVCGAEVNAASSNDLSEEAAAEFLKRMNKESGEKANIAANAEWDYESNITPETLANKLNVSSEIAKWKKNLWVETIKYPWKTYKNEDIKRQFKLATVLGMAALPDDKFKRLDEVTSKMETIYSTAKICDFHDKNKCDLSLEPEITELLRTSRDPEELKHIWVEWHKASGGKCKELYEEYVKISNEGAKLNNMSDLSELWNFDFESETFEKDVLELWFQVEPLYLQLHAYMRKKLWDKYGENTLSRTGPIPAHLMGNMWAQTWSNLFDFTAPYPKRESLDVTEEMIKQNYTALKMFQVAEDFFKSVNLTAMPPLFWERSLIEKPEGKELVCHASAWDFYNGEDFRIKMCTRIEMDDLLTIHHEMGHIQYYLQYKDQPYIYKEGANSGFHEAVGDVIFLSAGTRKHLQTLGLLKGQNLNDNEQELNSLFQRALDKVSFLPFGLLVDLYRWNVFKGKTTPETYNRDWWILREKYQGVEPPVDRTEQDFDPAAKYHVVASVPYVRYFVSFIIQFQFHRALCIEAGEFDPQNPSSKPLYECSIYKNAKAGNLLGKMLKLGSSKPWPEAMEILTGQRKMDGTALLQFFQPLHDWLKAQNEKSGEKIGWEPSKRNYGQQQQQPTTPASASKYAGSTEVLVTLICLTFFLRLLNR
ncbi:angiotensin-converting enzyme isoform X2 [Halyomorpha halys]|uniref:angiotensin-converting enzyme isoform X2 n=1 Tax=Halyomorpha halys TaxID=286706 RepID=UPI0006D4EE4E|nr:angiotensin-converting enzyme-like isoform X2 [Halyomorpha halys]